MRKFPILIVCIVAILASLYLLITPKAPSFNTSLSDNDKRIVSYVYTALTLFKRDNGDYPNSIESLYTKADSGPLWNGPYLATEIDINDSWGRKWVYKYPHNCNDNAEHAAFYSVGKNGIDECMAGDDIFINMNEVPLKAL